MAATGWLENGPAVRACLHTEAKSEPSLAWGPQVVLVQLYIVVQIARLFGHVVAVHES
jgi:hypothetical protein